MENTVLKEREISAEESKTRIEYNIEYPNKPVFDVFKRLFDILASIAALVLLSPLFLVVMAAIFIDDPGPVIFTQKRVGRNGKEFSIFKFRSMKVDADKHKNELMDLNEGHGATFKMEDDPRVTRVGSFIRRTSIDELPQLINILIGNMSVVGPRPFVPEEQEKLPKDRLFVKPGLSCYWQIMGKNTLTVDQQNALDRKYIKERSFLVDLKIIFKTIKIVMGRNNV